MTSQELREKFLEFFKKRGHTIVPSSSLIPDDPSVLLTTAGMQQFKKYYTEPSLAPAPNVASIQKCFRTSDIDEIGDDSHLTFFEMLGNFSFGGYFKEDAIKYAKEFLENIGLNIEYVTVFGGDAKAPFDEESYKIWQSLGVKDIKKAGREDNFWGPTGATGPCGPTTEIYIGGTEIWNIVFNEYYCNADGTFTKLETPGVDTGMGLERLAMVSQNKKNIFETDLFEPLIELAQKQLSENHKRIFADHMRAVAFLISDGIQPSKSDRGAILRRLMRRLTSIFFRADTDIETGNVFSKIVEIYSSQYPELKIAKIDDGFADGMLYREDESFRRSFHLGKQRVEKVKIIDAHFAFLLHQSFGWTYEMIKDFDVDKTKDLTKDDFDKENKKHQEISRAGIEKKFGGHGLLLDTGELKAADEEELKKVTSLHTATHLLQAALRKVLGESVKQAGSDITAERTRFDFTYDRKLTDEEIKKIEDLVNWAVSKKFDVQMKEMLYEEAMKSGALHFFKEKYPPKVKVYSVGDFKIDPPEIFSRELCGGPHVKNTLEIGNFKILKQEPIGSGLRRIRAIIK